MGAKSESIELRMVSQSVGKFETIFLTNQARPLDGFYLIRPKGVFFIETGNEKIVTDPNESSL
jgi:hypothetical protein